MITCVNKADIISYMLLSKDIKLKQSISDKTARSPFLDFTTYHSSTMAANDIHVRLCLQEIVKLDLEVKALIQVIID